MFKYFSQAFKVTNNNIILTTPLVLFLFLLSIYLELVPNAPKNLFSSVLLLTTILFMISAFFSGWLYMVKQAVTIGEAVIIEEDSKESLNLIKEIPTGIGEYFLPFMGGLVLYLLFVLVLFFTMFKAGMHFIGDVGLDAEKIKTILSSSAAMKETISSMSKEQLLMINSWNLMLFGGATIFSYLTMFWAPEIIYSTRNPFIAFFKSIIKVVKNFISTAILFIYISVINTLVSFLNAISAPNPILYFIAMLIYFYFFVYVVVLVFLYYDKEIKETNN